MISFVEIVEPLEDTQCELAFAQKPLFSTLAQPIPTSSDSQSTDSADLDEVEVRRPPKLDSAQLRSFWHCIQKGVLQILKGLYCLH